MKKSKNVFPIIEHFKQLNDFREQHKIDHLMIDIVGITICAVLANANSWTEIEEFAHSKKEWLQNFFELPNDIPSHDAFRYFFMNLNPKEFQTCFIQWIKSLSHCFENKLISIDGKTLRHSFDTKSNKKAIHMISAFASELNLVLGQIKTEEKSNEITAIPELLKLLEIKGAIISIDAMGCQKKIAKQIIDKKADYLLAVKENQKSLYDMVNNIFNKDYIEELNGFDSYFEKEKYAHGRSEKRTAYILEYNTNLMNQNIQKQWSGISMIGKIISERLENNKITQETRYYICSKITTAKEFCIHTRNHWGIENKLHWVLDVCFREDDDRKRAGYSDNNFSKIRALALNILKADTTYKKSIKLKRYKASLDLVYLESILMNYFHA